MTTYLRSKTNGIVLEHNDRLAKLPEWEVVTEQEAFPERFAPVALDKREQQVVLTVAEEAVQPPVTAPAELVAEASRPFASAKATRATRNTNKPSSAGLKGDF